MVVELATGVDTTGCAKCGCVFASSTAFDLHWLGWGKPGSGCALPAVAGMVVLRTASNGVQVWGRAGVDGYHNKPNGA